MLQLQRDLGKSKSNGTNGVDQFRLLIRVNRSCKVSQALPYLRISSLHLRGSLVGTLRGIVLCVICHLPLTQIPTEVCIISTRNKIL